MSSLSSASSAAASSTPTHIRIFTLNCWGLKFLAKHRNERLSEIGRQIALISPPPDIVGLQECWTQQDFDAIRHATRDILPHGKFYYGGMMGAGLAILSRFPIEDSSMFAYPLNGRPTAFFRGDWFVGKGVACATVRFGPRPRDVASVFCTHLHAPYEREPHDSYLCHRTAQAWEIAKLMHAAAERGHLVIALGDFNMLPSSFAHALIRGRSPVRDAWQIIYPDSSVGPADHPEEKRRRRPVPSAEFNLRVNGATCDGKYNTWRWTEADRKRLAREDVAVDPEASDPRGKRLDYIFVGDGGSALGDDADTPRWSVESVRLGMTQRHPTLRCSLSDHFSVEAVITRTPTKAVEQLERDAQRHGVQTLGTETYDRILEMIATYVVRERTQRRWRLTHFVVSVLVSIGCGIGVWWTGDDLAYVAFILVLVSTLSFGAGILDGLIGGLFVSSELRALKEFEWEVRNARALASAAAGLDDGEEA